MANFEQPEVTLRVNGLRYGGWKDVEIFRSIEAITGTFSLGVSELSTVRGKRWEIRRGDECDVSIGNTVVLTGIVESRTVEVGIQQHSLKLAGRDTTRDLVDSSVDLGKWEFSNTPALGLMRKVGEAFGVKIELAPGVVFDKKLEQKLSINVGDTGFSVIDRLARFYGFLPICGGNGVVVLTQGSIATAPVRLVEGQNLLSFSVESTDRERFYKYVVFSQAGSGTDIHVRGEYVDEGMSHSRRRTLIIQSETAATKAAAVERAKWEAMVRAARAVNLTCSFPAWSVNGYLWKEGDLIEVESPTAGITGTMKILSVKFVAPGKTCELVLTRPDAFAPLPPGERAWEE